MDRGKARLLILPFILALIVSIVIVINPVDAKRGGHDRGGGHSDKGGDKGGHGGRGGDHGHDNHGGHGGDDNGDDNGDGNGDGNGNGNGKSKSSRDRDGGGECAMVDGVNPCIMARPKIDRGPTEIAPGVFQYYGAFGQVIGTSIVTRYDDQLELDLVTSSPEFEPIVPRETIQEPPPVAIVKKVSQDQKPEKVPEVRKRTILPPEKSADPILDILILQALERPVQASPAAEIIQPVEPCQCLE